MSDPVVILLHGIRTAGAWQTRVKTIFEAETDATVIPIKYGYFDLLRFVAPSKTIRSGPVVKVRRELQQVLKDHPGRQIIVFAHSFGSYVISRVLNEERDIKIDRLILCGSVVDTDFDWPRVGEQITDYKSGGNRIINECGARDVLPVLASSVTWGYGSSGTFGMGTGGVLDRFHSFGHSGFFEEAFVRKYWLPIIKDEKVVSTEADRDISRSPWYFWLLRFPLKLPLILPAAIFIWIGALVFPNDTSDELRELISQATGNEAIRRELIDVTGELNATRVEVSTFLGIMLGEKIPESEWVHAFGKALRAYNATNVKLEHLIKLIPETSELQAILDRAQRALASGGMLGLDTAQDALREVGEVYQERVLKRREDYNQIMLTMRTTEAELAEARFQRLEAAGYWMKASEFANGRDKLNVLKKAGQAAITGGNLNIADGAYQAALDTIKQLAKAEPGNTEWQSNLSTQYNLIGDLYSVLGDWDAAEIAYLTAFSVSKQLAQAEPDETKWQRDLSISYGSLGKIAFARGDFQAAQTEYQAKHKISKQLNQAEPGNMLWQSDLSNSLGSLGNIAFARGNFRTAQSRYQAKHNIAKRLAQEEPENSKLQNALLASHGLLGNIAFARGDLKVAQASFQESIKIAERLTQKEPGNIRWQRGLMASHGSLGNIAFARGNLQAAETEYQVSIKIAEELRDIQPRNIRWRRDLSISHGSLGNIAFARGNLQAAEAEYQVRHDIVKKLAQAMPSNTLRQYDLSISYSSLGNIALANGNLQAAQAKYQVSINIAEELTLKEPGNIRWQRSLMTSYYKMYLASPDNSEQYLRKAIEISSRSKKAGWLASESERLHSLLEHKWTK